MFDIEALKNVGDLATSKPRKNRTNSEKLLSITQPLSERYVALANWPNLLYSAKPTLQPIELYQLSNSTYGGVTAMTV